MWGVIPRVPARCKNLFAQVPTNPLPFASEHFRRETVQTKQGETMQGEEISEAIVRCAERFVSDLESQLIRFLTQKMVVCFNQAASALGWIERGDIEEARKALGLLFLMHGMPIPGTQNEEGVNHAP